jgi:hypothetical protein
LTGRASIKKGCKTCLTNQLSLDILAAVDEFGGDNLRKQARDAVRLDHAAILAHRLAAY